MAIYSLSLGFVSRSAGRSAVGFSAYIGAAHQKDERTGVTYNFGCKNDVIVSRILAPANAPAWALNPSQLWNRVEAFEDEYAALRFRGDHTDPIKNQKSLEAKEKFLASAQTAQTIIGALPIEFTKDQAETCTEEFLNERFVSRGLGVQYAIHWDKGNPHFHGIITRRALVEGKFSQGKDREIVTKAELFETRKVWQKVANKHLELGGYDVRIDSRSNEDRGSLFLATEHEGWHAQRLAEKGLYSRIVGDNDAIRQANIKILCDHPEALIHEVALKRTTFTKKHLEEEIIRRVGGDETLFALLKAKVEGVEISPELVLKTANQDTVFEGGFAAELKKIAGKLTDQLLWDKDVSHEVGENLNRHKTFTSSAYKKQEEALLGFADILSRRDSKGVSPDLINRSISNCEAELGFELSVEQKGAITHLCSGPDIRILNGKAGTGKTTLMKAVAEAYQEAGYEVMGSSFQGKAVEIMEKDIGITCKTLDSFLHAWEKHQTQKNLVKSGRLWGRPYIYAFNRMKELEKSRFTSKNVIILDEANMIGGHLWEPFLKEAVDKGVKVLIVQDPFQIKSQDPGDYGRLFAHQYGFVETAEVVRQRVDWQRECSKLLNEHQVLDGLKPYYDKGYLTWFNTREGVTNALAKDYVKDALENPHQSRIALAYRNTECFEINQAIRGFLKEHGLLQDTFQLHGEEYAIGDRIRFTQNDNHGRLIQNKNAEDQTQLKGVKNGTFGTIEAYDSQKLELTVRLDGTRCVHFNTRIYTHITHGYAMSIHKSESNTLDKSFVSFDPLMTPSTLLVAMSRHRVNVQAYVNREQFIDFKDVVDRIGRISLKETVQDYRVPEYQKPYFNRVQQYRDLTCEAASLREEMEGALEPNSPLHKHPSYSAYQTCFEEKKRVAITILEDWKQHVPYARLAGIRKDVLEVEAGLRPRLLSDLEHRASIQVQGYMDFVGRTRTLWKDISQTHPGALAHSHERYEEYKELKIERDSLASIFQENQRLYAPFFKVTKDEASGEMKDYWEDVVTKDTRVYWAGVKSHAEAHFKSQMETLNRERLPAHQKIHFDVVKAYVQTRNEAAAIYGHMQTLKGAPVQERSPQSALTLEKFHDLQKRRDELALKIVESSSEYQPFFDTFKIKEDKLLTHAVAGELREKITLYANEINPEKRAQQADALKRILTTSKDYQLLKASGLDSNRLTFDIAFYDKVKTGEIASTLNPDQIYKPIQDYLKSSQESAQLWKILSSKTQEEPLLQKQWETVFQARNENASLLMNNQVALSVISGMRPDIHTRIKKQAKLTVRETPQKPGQPFISAEQVLQSVLGHASTIVRDLLGEPNKHMSTTKTLRFGKKGSLLVNIGGDKQGFWIDFETGEKGNLIQLVERTRNLGFKDALNELKERLMGHRDLQRVSPRIKPVAQQMLEQDKDLTSRLNSVAELHQKSKPIQGTIAETYLRTERKIETAALGPDLRYIPEGTSFTYKGKQRTTQHPTLAALGRNGEGKLQSIQLTKLNEKGTRALSSDGDKLPKIQYGVGKGSFVTIQEGKDTDRVFIAEGVETALSIKEASVDGKIVVSMGIHNMSNYKGSENRVILCTDNDTHKPSSQTAKIIEAAKLHLREQGKFVTKIEPINPGQDFNDVLKDQGRRMLQVYVKSYLTQSAVDLLKAEDQATKGAIFSEELPKIKIVGAHLENQFKKLKECEGTPQAAAVQREIDHFASSIVKDKAKFENLKTVNPGVAETIRTYLEPQIQTKTKCKGLER
jgi:ATP-dependent exoDNAse (exonuclease V) alpha subunit